MSRAQRSKLYQNWLKEQQTPDNRRAAVSLVSSRPVLDATTSSLLLKPNAPHWRHDMSPAEMCTFVSQVAPLQRLGYYITGIVGSGSYGLVLDVMSATGMAYVMKVSRVTETKLPPVRFPILNNQKTAWHTIALHDFKRGVRAQQRMGLQFQRVRIPTVLHAGCVDLNEEEKMGIIIMQKVHGKTLRKVLGSSLVGDEIKKFLVRKAAKIAAQFHTGGAIHGDGPHMWNLICDGSGHLHVIDFDRSCMSVESSHRLHDIGMMLDTMDSKFWPAFCDAYFGVPNSPNPFVLHAATEEERKKELHEQSRSLFKNYLEYLRAL